MTYGKHFSAQNTPQSQPLPGRAAEMEQNKAGGFTFKIDDWQRLRRFLILGCEGGTYYQGEGELTLENADTVLRCIREDGLRVVAETVQVSDQGLAPKNEPAIFVLALASKHGDEKTVKAAYEALNKVCRIGTHLFRFAEYREAIGGGWGSGMRRAVAKWYTSRSPMSLINQVLKYQRRNEWSHHDLLRLAHPQTENETVKLIFDAICEPTPGKPRFKSDRPHAKGVQVSAGYNAQGWEPLRNYPLVDGWYALMAMQAENALDPHNAAKIVSRHMLPRELIPTEVQNAPDMWNALLPHLGYTALVRNLGNMGKSGLLKPLAEFSSLVCERLTSAEDIKQSRIHPWTILLAAKTYAMGHGLKGKGTWTVTPNVVDALDAAFELSFGNIEPTGKRFLLGIDISSSMMDREDKQVLAPAEAAAAMAMITLRSEPQCYAMGFAQDFRDLQLTARDSLGSILSKTTGGAFGGTDCAIPMMWAAQNQIDVDVFVVYSDQETWAGQVHAAPALQRYRKARGIPAKFANLAFTATGRALADPKDAGSMNFVGMDASLPQALAAFVLE